MTILYHTILGILLLIVVTLVFICYEHNTHNGVQDTQVGYQSITIGNHPECKVDIPLETWEHLNEMQVYHWVSACEDAVNATE